MAEIDYQGMTLLAVDNTKMFRDLAADIVGHHFPGLRLELSDRFSEDLALITFVDCILTAPYDVNSDSLGKEEYFEALRREPSKVIIIGDLVHETEAKDNGFHFAFRSEVVDGFYKTQGNGTHRKHSLREAPLRQGKKLIKLIQDILSDGGSSQVVIRDYLKRGDGESSYRLQADGVDAGYESIPGRALAPLHARRD